MVVDVVDTLILHLFDYYWCFDPQSKRMRQLTSSLFTGINLIFRICVSLTPHSLLVQSMATALSN